MATRSNTTEAPNQFPCAECRRAKHKCLFDVTGAKCKRCRTRSLDCNPPQTVLDLQDRYGIRFQPNEIASQQTQQPIVSSASRAQLELEPYLSQTTMFPSSVYDPIAVQPEVVPMQLYEPLTPVRGGMNHNDLAQQYFRSPTSDDTLVAEYGPYVPLQADQSQDWQDLLGYTMPFDIGNDLQAVAPPVHGNIDAWQRLAQQYFASPTSDDTVVAEHGPYIPPQTDQGQDWQALLDHLMLSDIVNVPQAVATHEDPAPSLMPFYEYASPSISTFSSTVAAHEEPAPSLMPFYEYASPSISTFSSTVAAHEEPASSHMPLYAYASPSISSFSSITTLSSWLGIADGDDSGRQPGVGVDVDKDNPNHLSSLTELTAQTEDTAQAPSELTRDTTQAQVPFWDLASFEDWLNQGE